MKVKVRRRKPAPVAAEQAMKMLTESKPNLYSVVQKAICDTNSANQSRLRSSSEK